MIKLGINIDHVATLRQARGTKYPSVVEAALRAEQAGADSITLHLREDRRHMQDEDIFAIRPLLQTKMNLELAATDEMIAIASRVKPQDVCIVPERREERTTEGGLNLKESYDHLYRATQILTEQGSRVSLFIAPDLKDIDLAKKMGAPVIEIHTGSYADAEDEVTKQKEFKRVKEAAEHALSLGLIVNAGHGLHYHNVNLIAAIPGIEELNIGHAIVAHALFVGWDNAIREMKLLLRDYSK
ncbi:pyridoxine 5'-phosphate synthase [Candidatus Methylopumilus universalis]|jgi:pyridoxine 5-phosphate synthase|uniref:Pyridoxine 5'-phosphate synthase n=1 Tax=Candidatus Methylopumilus universalis TaxID=2588536 RepID=A0AAX1EZP6_9PROT|nr:pyridoxine 5'-phosphate synthase [Candidatus Methylopumilus universalis]QDC41308.1 pyridoxine 5'-phosphate synthase [Candidatus Methylopumilus universalis]QDC42591.1 pyridoxine 5'-phosphate synthase [Candidatus Methylopumilus universalis]QDC54977.1 pyridoxine 5'-phosphate synthase [Candidatus Methylopumilus universalis]QDC56258.1 pyridoxine 5'-phosphate synthase [Candidatus Methylopumilus universalis]QDC57547.1 pyridoxine 5'-phosphate synthase [Candidatus Methylopumilus universalis]